MVVVLDPEGPGVADALDADGGVVVVGVSFAEEDWVGVVSGEFSKGGKLRGGNVGEWGEAY